jgi:hypothetical protein
MEFAFETAFRADDSYPNTLLEPLPLVLTFIDTEEHVSRVLPHIREMAPHRLNRQ